MQILLLRLQASNLSKYSIREALCVKQRFQAQHQKPQKGL